MFTENLKTPEKFIVNYPYRTCTYHRNAYLNNIHNIKFNKHLYGTIITNQLFMVRLAGIEPAHPVPETGALSPEL